MKKLISVLMALCLLCAASAALAETAVVTFDQMPLVVTVEEGTELTDADFEGEWVVDKVFFNQTYLAPEEVEANGLNIHPMRIGEGKLIIAYTDEEGTHETSTEYKLESNQLLVTDEEGVESVFEKLEDGNLVMSIFLPSEDGSTMNCVSFFLVHPAE